MSDLINIDTLKDLSIKNKNKKNNITISVIIPNYNNAKYITHRIYSILYQKAKINEIIILDDSSNDNSLSIIEKIIDNIKDYIDIKLFKNKVNTNNPFKQWLKGIKAVTSSYIWIAEADDYADENLLSKLIENVDEDTVISYASSSIIDDENVIILKDIKEEIDPLKTKHFIKGYKNNGIDEITNYMFINCPIINVSSCIFKRLDNIESILEESTKYKLSGDWLFYIKLLEYGNISYSSKVLNYHRIHAESKSSNVSLDDQIIEIRKIFDYIIKKHNINIEKQQLMKDRIEFIKEHFN